MQLNCKEFIYCYYYFETTRKIRNIAFGCIALILLYLQDKFTKILSINSAIVYDINWVSDELFGLRSMRYSKYSTKLTKLYICDKNGLNHRVSLCLFGHEYEWSNPYHPILYKKMQKSVYLTATFDKIDDVWNVVPYESYFKQIDMELSFIIYDTNHTKLFETKERLTIWQKRNWCYFSADLYKHLENGCIMELKISKLKVFNYMKKAIERAGRIIYTE